MELIKLIVEDFKRVKRVELSLADLNILVGSNSSGKSSILQATHLACCMFRQAARVDMKGATVGIEEIDYLPSNLYKKLGHKTSWGSSEKTPSSKVSLGFRDEAEYTAYCALGSARGNAGVSIRGSVPSELSDLLRRKSKFFSAYIPGISGIPNREEKRSKKVVLKACSYGDSNIILRNALLLLQSQDPSNISLIETWIGEIMPAIEIKVTHNDETDLSIQGTGNIGNDTRPIELLGTGYLQLIQLFCYVLLFSPGILLIDEPDIHLHPSVQEKLMKTLARIAQERNMKVLLTTHSPFVVRGAPLGTNVYWLVQGKVASTNREAVELALGWGAFGKKAIVVSEDSKSGLLKKLVAQWPELEALVAFYPNTGYTSLPKPEQAAEMAKALGGSYKILIHRDRDSLTDGEVVSLQAKYTAEGTTLWCPEQSDVEAYFCSASFIDDLTGCGLSTAQGYIDVAIASMASESEKQFTGQRKAHNNELNSAGGSPVNATVWAAFQSRPLKGAKGKSIFNQLKNGVPGSKFRSANIEAATIRTELAGDLKVLLENLVR